MFTKKKHAWKKRIDGDYYCIACGMGPRRKWPIIGLWRPWPPRCTG